MTNLAHHLRLTPVGVTIDPLTHRVDERLLAITMFVGALGSGGAERQAVALALELHRRGHRVSLLSLRDGPMHSLLQRAGIPVEVVRSTRGASLASLPSVTRVLRHQLPDVVYAFLDTPSLLALAARPFACDARVVLGVRSSQYQRSAREVQRRSALRLTRYAAQFADLLIANSTAGLTDFQQHVVRPPRGIVIPNGVDTARFFPDVIGRARVRNEWNVGGDDIVIGHVAAFDPNKDHETLFAAFARAAHVNRRLTLVCVGEGTAERIAVLRDRLAARGLTERVRLVNSRDDVAAMYSAFDLFALTSIREGFPTVVAEAMVCGVPAVVTDTGASSAIVGGLGEVVPVGDVNALASALLRMAEARSPALSARCRLHVLAEFTLSRAADRTVSAFLGLVASASGS